jgi:enoyl-CoA hydratase/carnithine racemase
MVGRISGAVLGYLAYSAEPIDTSRAMQFGLVSRAFSEPRFDEEAEQFLALLASRNRSELAAIKSLIRSKENGATIDLAAKSFAVARF